MHSLTLGICHPSRTNHIASDRVTVIGTFFGLFIPHLDGRSLLKTLDEFLELNLPNTINTVSKNQEGSLIKNRKLISFFVLDAS